MTRLFSTLVLLGSIIALQAQSKDKLAFADYEAKLDMNRIELAELEAPALFSTCKRGVETSYKDRLFSGGCAGTIERTWTAKDGCGRETKAIQYINLIDTEAPVFLDVPEEITLSKKELETIDMPTVTDDCDLDVKIDIEDRLIDVEEGNELLRTWIAVDDCGHQTREQTRIVFLP